MDLLSLNERTNVFEYNCGGFALGTYDWYEPRSWRNGRSPNEMLWDCAENIMEDFDLIRVLHPAKVPAETDVIGFRLSVEECESENEDEETDWDDYIRDFHFVLRHDGTWYHKPGSREIDTLDEETVLCDNWPTLDYNSEIIWMIKR